MRVTRTERAGLAAAAMLAAVITAHAASAARTLSQPIARPIPFIATYTVAWHGISAGTSTLELSQTAPQLYLYTSTDSAWGIFRVAFPHPLRQSSRFRISAGGEVEPLAFQAGGAGNDVMAQFNWADGQVTGMAKGKLLDLKLHPGTQDPLSVQIAIMLKLEAQNAPAGFWMLNTDEIDHFHYVRLDETTLDTPLGKLRAILYTSHAHGSDKTTYLWLAPALDYMPARAEQRVKGNTQLSLQIRTFAHK
jgi:hypothetical protein